MAEIEYPEELLFLINEPSRYKVLYGGRGGMKTETIAIALIILASQKKLRIACFREIQKSISESVYETIKNRIIEMGWEAEFDIQATTIISKRTGAEFIFFGLRYNINSIKSIARIDIAWVEEATNVSKVSWDKLTPTIRGRGKNIYLENIDQNKGGPFGRGTEIWISFNPELDTDETYKRFILKREQYAPDYVMNENGEKVRYAFVKMLSYQDNPWLPDDLKLECELLKATDEDEWMHVWGGFTKQTLTGAIYAKEVKKVLVDGRRGSVKYDATRPVHTFWDLGHDDNTSIWFVQQVGVEYNLINFFQDRLQKIPYYLEKLQEFKYNYGFHYLPHDGDSETLASRSTAKIVRDAYPGKVKIVPRIPKKIVGIRAARMIFDLCNFDEENTADGWQCLCRYCYDVNEDGKFSVNPRHDEYSHGADAFQTFALSLRPEQKTPPPKTVGSGKVVRFHGSSGWMGR
jgi:phage terminase large subunit